MSNEAKAGASPPSEQWTRQKCFDIVFKKYWLARESESVSSEIIDVLETFVTEAFNESDVWLTHPRLVKTAFSLLLDDLSDSEANALYRGLTTVLSHGIDQSIFADMDDDPFFADDLNEGILPDTPVVEIDEIKGLAAFITEQGFEEFSFENSHYRIAFKKKGDEKTTESKDSPE